MSLLRPALLALALLAIPILLLYVLRLRRQEVLVSSTMLWQQLLRDREANAPWQRLRRNLLLILQLLLLASLVIALARPFWPVSSVVSGNVVVLLDGTASMLAEDVRPNRFAAAQAEVARMIDDLSGSDQMTLIQVGPLPEVLASASTDRNQLRQALEEARAAPAAADWPSAMALAAGAAQGFREAQIVVVSDGGLPSGLPPSPVPVVYVPIGEAGDNLAVSALATRPQGSQSQLLAGLGNTGQAERRALFSVRVDGELFDSRWVDIPANGDIRQSWLLPERAEIVEASISATEGDFLAVDNTAWTVNADSADSRALLIGEGNRFLETAFGLMPAIELFRRTPSEATSDQEYGDADFVVLDGVPLSAAPPAADLLVIDPRPNPAGAGPTGNLFQVGGTFSQTVVTQLVDHPLLRFVDWGNVNVREASRVEAPWARPLIMAEGGPLLLVGEQNGRRIVMLTFRLQDSDLPLQIAFPVLLANITNWLGRGQAIDAQGNVMPGDPVRIRPSGEATAIAVRDPGGAEWRREADLGPVTFTGTDTPGIYQVQMIDLEGQRLAGRFAVNLFSPQESSIRVAEVLRLGPTTVSLADRENIGQREFWPWLAATGLALLVLEWWIYHRGRSGLSWRGLLSVLRGNRLARR